MRRSMAPSWKQLKMSSELAGSEKRQKILKPRLKPTSDSSGICKKYIVCYGRVSTKVHKTFSDDGTLEISGKKAVLKDFRGTIVGSTMLKFEVEEGSRVQMSGKLVEVGSEIVEEASNCQNIVDVDSTVEAPTKKLKLMTPELVATVATQPSAESLEGDSDAPYSPLPCSVSQVLADGGGDESTSYSPDEGNSSDISEAEVPVDVEVEETKKFIVCYAKASSKLHKVYDCDGSLEVRGKSAVLKNAKGKIVGSTKLKENIDDATTFQMSGKDIQIVERVTSN